MTDIKEPVRTHNIPGPVPVPKEQPTRVDRGIKVNNWPTREKTTVPASPGKTTTTTK
jgi:hypothetical protein